MSHEISARATILVVDDKTNLLSLMEKVLQDDGIVLTADSGHAALALLESHPVDVVLCDLRIPDVDGLEILRQCRGLRPHAEFILMTAFASVDTAIEAMRLGAYDYLSKPFEPEAGRAVVLRAIRRAMAALPASAASESLLPNVIGSSAAMQELSRMVRQIADSDATVLLLGETGTGKERVARAVHALSPRREERFVAINCAAIPPDLLESELFGAARGAYTGAGKNRRGLFEEADHGTLFLDEIGELRLSLQAKLTRALEERAVRRLGESSERPVDVRVIAATNRDVQAMVASESFREDLWYRLNVAVMNVPPLRTRREDIEVLAVHFLRERLSSRNSQLIGFTPAAIDALERYEWPGNVRQLRSAVERAGLVATGERIDIGDLPPDVLGLPGISKDTTDLGDLTWAQAQERGRAAVARRYLTDVLTRFDGQVADAAAHAGVERESFYRLLRRFDVDVDQRSGR